MCLSFQLYPVRKRGTDIQRFQLIFRVSTSKDCLEIHPWGNARRRSRNGGSAREKKQRLESHHQTQRKLLVPTDSD